MTNLDSILKSRDITLLTKVCLVKDIIFPVVVYGCESWTIKKAEHRRSDAFELWCWRRLLIIPWTARRSNQSILKEISPEYPLPGLMLKLKLQYFAHLIKELTHWKRPWYWERLKAGEGDDRGGDGLMATPTQWTWVWVSSGRLAGHSPWVGKESDTYEQLTVHYYMNKYCEAYSMFPFICNPNRDRKYISCWLGLGGTKCECGVMANGYRVLPRK